MNLQKKETFNARCVYSRVFSQNFSFQKSLDLSKDVEVLA